MGSGVGGNVGGSEGGCGGGGEVVVRAAAWAAARVAALAAAGAAAEAAAVRAAVRERRRGPAALGAGCVGGRLCWGTAAARAAAARAAAATESGCEGGCGDRPLRLSAFQLSPFQLSAFQLSASTVRFPLFSFPLRLSASAVRFGRPLGFPRTSMTALDRMMHSDCTGKASACLSSAHQRIGHSKLGSGGMKGASTSSIAWQPERSRISSSRPAKHQAGTEHLQAGGRRASG